MSPTKDLHSRNYSECCFITFGPTAPKPWYFWVSLPELTQRERERHKLQAAVSTRLRCKQLFLHASAVKKYIKRSASSTFLCECSDLINDFFKFWNGSLMLLLFKPTYHDLLGETKQFYVKSDVRHAYIAWWNNPLFHNLIFFITATIGLRD